MQLRNVDLNLLVILDALLQEASVTRAAIRISLSQPATSLALQRLRDLLGDPLLVRSGSGMVLTPMAESLRAPVARLLSDISDTLAGERFDPATTRQVFRITATDHVEIALLPGLMSHMALHAPHARIISQSVDALPMEGDIVMKGGVDLTIARLNDAPGDFHIQPLFEEQFVTVARKGHPMFVGGMNLNAFLAARHVLASPRGGSLTAQVDEALVSVGLTRNVVLSVPRFSVIPALLASSDMISTIPRLIAERPEWAALLDAFEVPIPVAGFPVRMAWHPRHHHSPAHRWLRQTVLEVARGGKSARPVMASGPVALLREG